MKTCKCGGKARCAFCKIEIRELRGDWRWRRSSGAGRAIGAFSGRVSSDGAAVLPFCGPGPVRLEQRITPGSEVSYVLVERDGLLIAERVRVAA